MSTGWIRISSHTRSRPKVTVKQRLQNLKSAVTKDEMPFKNPEVDIDSLVEDALIKSIMNLGQ